MSRTRIIWDTATELGVAQFATTAVAVDMAATFGNLSDNQHFVIEFYNYLTIGAAHFGTLYAADGASGTVDDDWVVLQTMDSDTSFTNGCAIHLPENLSAILFTTSGKDGNGTLRVGFSVETR